MSHNSEDRSTPNFNRYVQQNLIPSDDDESATLAEPMTLEGAKQLAQSTPPPTLTPPLPLPIHGATSPPPLLSSPTPPLSLHHHLSSPLHSSRHSLGSPQPPPLLTSSPHHLTSPTHLSTLHHHSLWPPPTRQNDPVSVVERDLPSTVDMQAIRDTPSPDFSAGKLVTINENWDSLEDQNISCDQDEEDDLLDQEESCDDDDSSDLSDSDSKMSDSDSNHSHISSKSPVHKDKKAFDINNQSSKLKLGTVSDRDSKSDESQDSDSESSCGSTSDGESIASSLDDVEERVLEPLPRRKPQLTAAKPKFSESVISPKNNSLIAKSRFSDSKIALSSPKKEEVNRVPSPLLTVEDLPRAIDLKKLQIKDIRSIEEDHVMKSNKTKAFSPKRVSNEEHALKVEKKSEDKKLNKRNLEKFSVENLCKSPEKSNSKTSVNDEGHLNFESKKESNSDESSEETRIHSKFMNWKLEKRRLKKKQEMDQEFDRLLNSSSSLSLAEKEDLTRRMKNLPSVKNGAKTTCYEFLEKNSISSVKKSCHKESRMFSSPRKVSIDHQASNKNESGSSRKHKEKETPNRKETKMSAFDKELQKADGTSSRNKLKRIKSPTKSIHKKDISPTFKKQSSSSPSKLEKSKTLVCDFSSDSKSIELSSTSSSESEELIPSSNNKRIPSLNATAKLISLPKKSSNSSISPKKSSPEYSISPQKYSPEYSISPQKASPEYSISPQKSSPEYSISPQKSSSEYKSPSKNIFSDENLKKSGDLSNSLIRSTIADIVKVRERRKSFEKDSSTSGEERERKPSSKNSPAKERSKMSCPEVEDETTSSSENSDDLNEKIDVDTEQTQTFSVSESNFSQGRLTMRIAAMKMAKFGKNGLKDVLTHCIPTRSEMYHSSTSNTTTSSGFKRPRTISKSSSKHEAPKVKTAAERKTYVDGLPATYSSLRVRKNKAGKSDMRVPVSTYYRTGGLNLHRPHNEVDDEISRIAQTLSQISPEHLTQHITNGLQVLDQEDLAVLLPDVSMVNRHPDNQSSLDPFPEHHSESDEELSGNETSHENENLLSMVMLPEEENNLHSLSFEENLSNSEDVCSNKNGSNEKSGRVKRVEISSKVSKDEKKTSRRNFHKTSCDSKESNEEAPMPELESFAPLDCNISNVSPDSGIQSVNGSPLHPVGSPNHHHSPFYSTNLGSSSSAAGSESSTTSHTSSGRLENSSLHTSSYSPNYICSPDTPPPPTLEPAVTPPHLQKPHFDYEDSSMPSPPMPSLTCEVPPPPWVEEQRISAEEETLKEQGSFNTSRGPGRPTDSSPPAVSPLLKDESEKNKRGRGRPKGSKNRKKCSQFINAFISREKKPTESFIREPSHSLATLGKESKESLTTTVPDIDYSAMKHNWRGSTVDLDEVPVKKGRGRPKKIAIPILKEEKSEPEVSKVKRPVGRPRKILKPEILPCENKSNTTDILTKKRSMPKTINEKVRSSEKSDKLSVHGDGREEEAEPSLSDKVPLEFKRRKLPSDGIPLEDKRRRRGRKKELPKIFEKVYGCIKSMVTKSEVRNETDKLLASSYAKKKKKKHKNKFKSKHKNIVDPVFLAEVEELSTEMEKCIIAKLMSLPSNKPTEALVPSIFRINTAMFNAKKKNIEKARNSDKESGTEGESGGKEKQSSKRKKKLQEVPKQGKERSEANEQRLPLKKRHRHISTAVPTSPDPHQCDPSKSEVSSPFKSPFAKLNKMEDPKTEAKEKPSVPKSQNESSKLIKYEVSTKFVKTSDNRNKEAEQCLLPNKLKVSEMEKNNLKESELIKTDKESQKLSTSESVINSKVVTKFFMEEVPKSSMESLRVELSVNQTDSKVLKTSCNSTNEFNFNKDLLVEKPVQSKIDHSQSMVATTPKKRHRLEAEKRAKSALENSPKTLDSVSNLTIERNSPSPTKLSPAKVKQEKDSKIKEIYGANISKDEKVIDIKCKDKKSDEKEHKVEEKKDRKSEEKKDRKPEEKKDRKSDDKKRIELPEINEKDNLPVMDEEPVNRESIQLDSPIKIFLPIDSGSHSDSDIPSEHEPLYESDQSGFMSDKEGTKEIPKKPIQKKRKKKKELCSVKKSANNQKAEKEISISSKRKRRKTNKTGFPTIRKKKKKPKVEEEVAEVEKDPLEDKVVEEPSDKKLKLEENLVGPKPRGRPKKMLQPVSLSSRTRSKDAQKNEQSDSNEIQNLKNILEHVANGIAARTRNKRDLSEESTMMGPSTSLKRQRKYLDEEVEDSDSNVVCSECPLSSEPASSDESCRSQVVRKKVPRWRKKYLTAGLFSDYYKNDEPQRKNGDASMNRVKMLTYDPDDYPHKLLPPPCYCRKWLRERHVDFALPFDIWWLHSHNMLLGRDLVPSWNYKKVKANVFYDVKPTHEFEVQACTCKKPANPEEKGCGEDCINRMMFIECTPQICPISDSCSNQRIQRHEFKTHLQRFMTTDKGWGIKTTQPLKNGAFILEYVGEVVSEKEFKHRMQTRYASDTHHYCLNLDRGMVIDGHRIGGDCRFVNHSCDPNCEMQKWFVNGQYRMALCALKEIGQNEELTYDYNFSLFNPTEGQHCKCGSENCRGVIGGRSQRLNGHPLEEKKRPGRNKKEMCKKRKRGTSTDTEAACTRPHLIPIKPLSHQQKLYILAHRCFLLRNLEKVRKSRDKFNNKAPETKKVEVVPQVVIEPDNKIEKFLTHFTALNTARSVKTRRLAQAEDDPHMTRVAKLAQIFKDIYDKLVASRDVKDKPLATPFMNLPSKKKYPLYYTRVGEPIDLTIIEKNILTGHYTSAEVFDQDIMRLFANNLRFYGRNTEKGHMAVGLRKVYSECKLQFKPLLEEVIGEDQLPQAFADCSHQEDFEDEDVIRCVCNLHRDEGMMIQCERCLVWQHCDCMGVTENDSPDHYLCEECSPRNISPEVPMIPQPLDIPNDHKYFITLLRDNLQIKQGDSVYILRDRPVQKSGERRQPAYKLAKDIKIHELLIFKVENLWIDEKGDKFAFGHHYLRPHETFHEPWRKFFPNEVIRSPHCEILPLDMIVNHCCVLDLNSYCRGRPIVASEDHVYVCEYRVDKDARVFAKISKPKYPICTQPYAFITFPTRAKPMRTYTPHEVTICGRVKKPMNKDSTPSTISTSDVKEEIVKEETKEPLVLGLPPSGHNATTSGSSSRTNSSSRKSRSTSRSKERTVSPCMMMVSHDLIHSKPKVQHMQRENQRVRVNHVVTRLLHLMPSKGAVDLSFLLENGKRNRKKTAAFSS